MTKGDVIVLGNFILGIAALAGALALGWFVSSALFVVNVSFAMLSIAFMAYVWMGKYEDEDPKEGTPHGVRYRALHTLDTKGEKTLMRSAWIVMAAMIYGAVSFALKTNPHDIYFEGTSMSFLIAAIWMGFVIGDLRQHIKLNRSERDTEVQSPYLDGTYEPGAIVPNYSAQMR